MKSWSCFPKHGPVFFTVLKHFLVWMVWSFSKTIRLMPGDWSFKHGPVSFTLLKNFFRLDVMQPFKPFKFMAGPRSPTSPVTAQLILQGSGVISFWCHADCQQRSNQRLVVLPQTRSSSFHGVKHLSRLGGMRLFKNIRFYGWAVLPQTRPSSFHGVDKPFRLDVMQPFKNF